MGRHARPLGRELITLLQHSQAEVRWSAVKRDSMRSTRRVPRAYSSAVAGRKHRYEGNRNQDAGADDANNVRYIDSIIAALDDHHPCVQRAALNALYRMRGRARKAIPRLEIMSASDTAAEHDYAQEVLAAIRAHASRTRTRPATRDGSETANTGLVGWLSGGLGPRRIENSSVL